METKEVLLTLLSGTNLLAIIGYYLERKKRKLEEQKLEDELYQDATNFYQNKFKDVTELNEKLEEKIKKFEEQLAKARKYILDNNPEAKI